MDKETKSQAVKEYLTCMKEGRWTYRTHKDNHTSVVLTRDVHNDVAKRLGNVPKKYCDKTFRNSEEINEFKKDKMRFYTSVVDQKHAPDNFKNDVIAELCKLHSLDLREAVNLRLLTGQISNCHSDHHVSIFSFDEKSALIITSAHLRDTKRQKSPGTFTYLNEKKKCKIDGLIEDIIVLKHDIAFLRFTPKENGNFKSLKDYHESFNPILSAPVYQVSENDEYRFNGIYSLISFTKSNGDAITKGDSGSVLYDKNGANPIILIGYFKSDENKKHGVAISSVLIANLCEFANFFKMQSHYKISRKIKTFVKKIGLQDIDDHLKQITLCSSVITLKKTKASYIQSATSKSKSGHTPFSDKGHSLKPQEENELCDSTELNLKRLGTDQKQLDCEINDGNMDKIVEKVGFDVNKWNEWFNIYDDDVKELNSIYHWMRVYTTVHDKGQLFDYNDPAEVLITDFNLNEEKVLDILKEQYIDCLMLHTPATWIRDRICCVEYEQAVDPKFTCLIKNLGNEIKCYNFGNIECPVQRIREDKLNCLDISFLIGKQVEMGNIRYHTTYSECTFGIIKKGISTKMLSEETDFASNLGCFYLNHSKLAAFDWIRRFYHSPAIIVYDITRLLQDNDIMSRSLEMNLRDNRNMWEKIVRECRRGLKSQADYYDVVTGPILVNVEEVRNSPNIRPVPHRKGWVQTGARNTALRILDECAVALIIIDPVPKEKFCTKGKRKYPIQTL